MLIPPEISIRPRLDGGHMLLHCSDWDSGTRHSPHDAKDDWTDRRLIQRLFVARGKARSNRSAALVPTEPSPAKARLQSRALSTQWTRPQLHTHTPGFVFLFFFNRGFFPSGHTRMRLGCAVSWWRRWCWWLTRRLINSSHRLTE